jgi:hypothetical protein
MADEKICASCACWMAPDPKAPAPYNEMGQCRHGPPQVAVVMAGPPPMTSQERKIIELAGGRSAPPQGPQPVFLSMWPSTKPGQGCHQWVKADG